MAFFQLRKKENQASTAGSGHARHAESIDAMRKRAKHRLIGASVLVLIGVVGFPLLFDTQPRPISVDIPIEIPDRNKAKPLPAPVPPVARAPASLQAPPPASATVTASVAPAPAPAPSSASAPSAAAKPQPKEEIITEPNAPAAKPDDGTRALALLQGKPVASAPVQGEARFVVQVGSFSDKAKVRETRQKVEHAGLKTYTQQIEKDGKPLVRVRVGPFATKAEADNAAEKLKGLDLPASVLSL